MNEDERTLSVATEISELLAAHGAACAVIGAVALAVRGYPRATEDLDLMTVTDFSKVIGAVAKTLEARGYEVDLSPEDADDPLGGVLTVNAPGAAPVQVVNYFNPWKGWAPVGKLALDAAEPGVLGSLSVVDVPHLVALKLYAGGRKSALDVMELLARHPDAVGASREVCRSVRLEPELDAALSFG